MIAHDAAHIAKSFAFVIALGFTWAAPTSLSAQDYKVPDHLLEGTHCHCRANGELYPQGDEICMMGTLRQCGMSQNVSSWVATGKTCHTSNLYTPRMTSGLRSCQRQNS